MTVASHAGCDPSRGESLRAYAEGSLELADADEVESHLADCAACRERLSRLPTRVDGSTPRLDGGEAGPGVPPRLPGYEVLRELGRGGMGVVYEAVHTVMGRRVAVKLIHPELLRQPAAVYRFRREARAAARLAHPNLVTAFSAGQAGGSHFLAMELVEGETLADLLLAGPLPVDRACAYVRQAALGLQHAHEAGLVHRDVKPQNLMRTADGTVKVLDFGLAALAGDGAAGGGQTAPDTIIGTPDYMAPEQAEDARSADARADIYALGCTLFHLLTGQAPFPAGTVMHKLMAHRRQAPPSARRLRPRVPPGLDAVLRRALAKRPQERFGSAGELADALGPFTHPDLRPAPRRRVVGLLAALLLAGLIMTAGVLRLSARKDRERVIEPNDPGGGEKVGEVRRLEGGADSTSPQGPAVEEQVGEVRRIRCGQGLMGRVDFLPDGHLVLASANPVGLWDVRTGQRVRALPAALGWFNWVAAVSPDGRRALLGTHLWDLETGQELRTLEGGTTKDYVLWDVKFSPDGRRAVFGSLKDTEAGTDTVWVCDVETGRLVKRFGNGEGARSVAYSPDGTRIAAGQAPTSDGEPSVVRLYDVETGKELRAFETPTVAFSLAFTRDGKRLLSAGGRTVLLWDLEGGKELTRFEGHTKPVEWAVFTSDDRRIVSVGGDGTVRVWDVAGGKEVACFRGHAGNVLGVSVSPDGRHALSGSWDGTLRLWRLPDPPEPGQVRGRRSRRARRLMELTEARVMNDRLKNWLLLAAAAVFAAAGEVRAQPLVKGDPVELAADLAAPAPSSADGPLSPHFSFCAPSGGWFVAAEADVVWPRITALRSDDMNTFLFDPTSRALNLNIGSAGEIDVGIRAANASGFMLSFRGGSWTGHKSAQLLSFGVVDSWGFFEPPPENSPSWDLHTRDMHTRLSFASIDLDYLGSGWAVGDSARLGWSMGVRAAWMGLVVTADDSFTVTRTTIDPTTGIPVSGPPTPELEHERVSAALGGGGVHMALDATWAMGDTGWALLARIDGGLLGAGGEERYSSVGADFPGAFSESHVGFLATINATAGVQYVLPCGGATLRVSAGYQFEAWWFSVMEFNFFGGSQDLAKQLDWQSHGLFVRTVFEF